MEDQLQSLADKITRHETLEADEAAAVSAILQILSHGFDPRHYFTPPSGPSFPRVAADIVLYVQIENARQRSTLARALEHTANRAGISVNTAKRVYDRVRDTYFKDDW